MSIIGGVIWCGNKTVVPESVQQQIIKLSHEGHQGILCCKQYVQSKVWFPGIDKKIEDQVKFAVNWVENCFTVKLAYLCHVNP